MAADVESNPLFGVLTDALRAGPGSPEWHQAVAKLRAEGLADTDEYRLLVAVREHLESGRDYRAIRAGPGFTRKVLEGIEQERQTGTKAGGIPLANIIAILSVLLVIGVVGYIASQLFPRSSIPQETVDDLEKAYFPSEVASAKFDGAMPVGWRQIGALTLESTKTGLKPQAATGGTQPATGPAEAVGVAMLAPQTLLPDEPFAVEVKLKPGRPTEDLIVQVFVSTEDDFSPDKATSSNELVWLLQGNRQKVIIGDSRVVYDKERPEVPRGEPLTVRLLVSRQLAVVSNGGPVLWNGNNSLPPKPRKVGVRFIQVDPSKPADPSLVQSIRILKK